MEPIVERRKHRECVLCGREIGEQIKIGAVFRGICIQKTTRNVSFVMFGMCSEHFKGYMSKKLESITSGVEVKRCLLCGVGEPDAILQVNVEAEEYNAEATFGLCTECWSQWTKYMTSNVSGGKDNTLNSKGAKLGLKMRIYKYLTISFLRISLHFHGKFLCCCGEGDLDPVLAMSEELNEMMRSYEDEQS